MSHSAAGSKSDDPAPNDKESTRRWWPENRVARAVLFFVAAAVAVELLYLVGANLSLRWASQRVAHRAGIRIDYVKAYTLVPGHVRFTQVKLSGVADGGWQATIATADIVVGLGDLVTLTSHLKRVVMNGVSVEVGLPPEAVALGESTTGRTNGDRSSPLVLGSILARASTGESAPPADGVASPRLQIDDARATVETLTYGKRKLSGTLDVRARDVVLRRVGTTLGHASAHVADATLQCGDDMLARGLVGSVSASIEDDADAANASARSIAARTTAQVTLDGALVSAAPLLSLAGLASSEPRVGKIHVSLAIEKGVISRLSELRAESPAIELRAGNGAVATLPGGLVITAGTSPSDDTRIQLTVHAPNVTLASSDPAEPSDTLDHVALTVDGGKADLAAPRPASRTLDFSAEHAVLHEEGATTLSAKLRGSLEIAAGPLDADGLVANGGELEATGVVVDRPPSTEHAPFGVRVLLANGQISKDAGVSFSGKLKADGPDAGALLNLFGTAPAVQLALGSIQDKPFTLDASISRGPDKLWLRGVRIESNGVTLEGAYSRRAATQHAAFVVTYRHLPLGVSIVDGIVHVVLAPPPSWLAAQTQSVATQPGY